MSCMISLTSLQKLTKTTIGWIKLLPPGKKWKHTPILLFRLSEIMILQTSFWLVRHHGQRLIYQGFPRSPVMQSGKKSATTLLPIQTSCMYSISTGIITNIYTSFSQKPPMSYPYSVQSGMMPVRFNTATTIRPKGRSGSIGCMQKKSAGVILHLHRGMLIRKMFLMMAPATRIWVLMVLSPKRVKIWKTISIHHRSFFLSRTRSIS